MLINLLRRNNIMIIRRFIYAIVLLLTVIAVSCNDENKAPTQDELFAQIPAEAGTVVAINVDSCSFVDDILPEYIVDYMSTTDAVLFTDADNVPVLMLRATDPMVLGQAAYDWIQVSFDTDEGHQLLSMSTSGGISTFTNSQFVWVMRADNAKEVMYNILNAKKSKSTPKTFRLKDNKLRDAASGRILLDGVEVPIVANVHGNTLRMLTGACIDNDTVKIADNTAPGVHARVDGAIAESIISRLTASLSFTHRMAVNAMSSFVEKAQTVDVEYTPADGISLVMHYNRADADAANIAKTLGTLAANAGMADLVATTAQNSVKAGPLKFQFDCAAAINIVQDPGKADIPAFTIDITIPGGIQNLLKTTPFTTFLQ